MYYQEEQELRARGHAGEQVISEHPAVLCYSPTQRLEPVLEYLATIGVGADMVARRPTLLGLEEASLRRITGYLSEAEGKTPEELVALLETI